MTRRTKFEFEKKETEEYKPPTEKIDGMTVTMVILKKYFILKANDFVLNSVILNQLMYHKFLN